MALTLTGKPLASSDALQYTNSIKELRVALNAYSPLPDADRGYGDATRLVRHAPKPLIRSTS